MAAEQKPIIDILTTLVHDPENDEQITELNKCTAAQDENLDKELDEAAHKVFSSQVNHSLAQDDEGQSPGGGLLSQGSAKVSDLLGQTTWANCIEQQRCYPKELRKVKTLDDILQAVNDAHQWNITLRVVGSGHSFSNVVPVFNGGLLLDPCSMDQVLQIDTELLKDPYGADQLFAVESGIKIQALNDTLWGKNLALQNMGAYDGQTLAGAISTGTHGTGISLGPIASSVRAVVLVSESGTVYQIEPSQGISDPEYFKKKVADRVLKQDDDWFNTALVAMGSIGVIYSYILEVRLAYWLTEVRDLGTWETEKRNLLFPAPGELPDVLKKNRHYEIDINPYDVGGAHTCIIQHKNFAKVDKKSGSRGITDWWAGILASWPDAEHWVVNMLNLVPKWSPAFINKALSALVHKKPYTDKCFTVLNIGRVNDARAMAIELSYPVDENLVDAIDGLLDIFKDEAASHKWYMAGPFALRFVDAADAYLAPQQGRLTCMVELDMMVGIKTGDELLRAIIKRVQAENPAVRVHWGLDLDTVNNETVPRLYPQFPKWDQVYRELNKSGLFDSPFTERLGISIPKE